LEVKSVSEIIWRPTAEAIQQARITRFLELVDLDSLEALQEKALQDPAWFWEQVVADLGIAWYETPEQTLDLSRGIAFPTWFRGASMNLANDCVDKHIDTHRRNKLAVIYEGEDGHVRKWSYLDLFHESNRLANSLREMGIGKGDRVAIFLPMLPETVASIMAIAKLGAIFTPIFSGFAPQAVASRLADAGAKLLITADGYVRRGKLVNMKSVADDAVRLAPAVTQILVVKRAGNEVAWTPSRDHWYHDAIAGQSRKFETLRCDPEDPVMVIYTSGTTGRPKGAVHVHCGFPLKAAQDMAHLFDLGEQDIMMWFTDIGWMMGPWLIFGTLMLGSTMFLYDGAPDFPKPDRFWEMVEQHGITHLGIAPTVVRSLVPHGAEWAQKHDLSSLRILGSSGELWNPEPYMWFFHHVGGDRCPIINYSGGTETSGGILGCVVTRPLKACSFNTAVPGMGVQVLDDQGKQVAPGIVGELALTVPWVGMTRGFWGDNNRYMEAYWSRFESIWVHGDWASVDAEGFWYIHGRSDDTIKIAGKRIGPAEFESVLVSHPAVAEAAAIGVPHEIKGEAVVCFAILTQGHEADPALERELKSLIATELGKPLIPEAIKFVGALPKTRNAKVMRRVIKAAFLGKELGDLSAIENPATVEEILKVRSLPGES
jgi:acetyl-CoA synthetase